MIQYTCKAQVNYISYSNLGTPAPDVNQQPITINPDNIVANEGDTVTLTCRSSVPRITLVWTKVQGRLPSTAQNSNGVLTLYRVTSQDSGLYLCSSQQNPEISVQAQILIESEFTAPPMARIEPKRLDIAQGQTGSLR